MTFLPGAVCRTVDPELFAENEIGGRTNTKKAIAICNTCPEIVKCLEIALANDDYGVWGGTTTAQRKQIRTARRQAA